MEITIRKDSTCNKCKGEITQDNKFCPHCGIRSQVLMRSENEIRIMLDKMEKITKDRLESKDPNEITKTMLNMMISIALSRALNWVLGETDNEPITFLNKPGEK